MLPEHPDRLQFMASLDAAIDAEKLGDKGEARKQKDQAQKLMSQQHAAEQDITQMGRDDLVDLKSAMEALKDQRAKDQDVLAQSNYVLQKTHESIGNGGAPDTPDAIRKDLLLYNEEHLRCLRGILLEAGIMANLKKWMGKEPREKQVTHDWKKRLEPIMADIGGRVEEEFRGAQDYGDFITQMGGWKADLTDTVKSYGEELKAWQTELAELKSSYAGATPETRQGLADKLASSRYKVAGLSKNLMNAGNELEEVEDILGRLEMGLAENFEEKLSLVLTEKGANPTTNPCRMYRDVVLLTREIGFVSRDLHTIVEHSDPKAFKSKLVILKTHVEQVSKKLGELAEHLGF